MNKSIQLELRSSYGIHDEFMAAVPALTKYPEDVIRKAKVCPLIKFLNLKSCYQSNYSIPEHWIEIHP